MSEPQARDTERTAQARRASRPTIRVLHVCYHLEYGGVQVMLTQLLERLAATEIQSDVLALDDPGTAPPAYLQSCFERVCGRLIIGPTIRGAYTYRRRFEALARQGTYDVVHANVDELCGYFLAYARGAGISHRIAHSHLDQRIVERRRGHFRRMHRRYEKWLIHRNATLGFACSADAAASLYGESWRADPRWQVLPNGMDVAAFAAPADAASVRAELGIPVDAFVVGHVGSHLPQKNPLFLLEVFRAVLDRRADAHLLLVGDGPLRGAIEQRIEALRLNGRVVRAGVRPHVAPLVRGAMDVFLFPSTHEGLGNAVIEAQTAGLPCLLSDRVPAEAIVVPRLVSVVSLQRPPEKWAEELLRLQCSSASVDRSEASELVRAAGLDIEVMAARLAATYRSLVGAGSRS